MTSSKLFVLYALVFLQGAWGMPATSPVIPTAPATSYGTQFQNDFNKNLAAVMNNMYSGTSSLAAAPIKLSLDTVPNIINHGISTAADKTNKIAAASKEGFGKVGVGAGHLVGGLGVLGSATAGGAMQLVGHGAGAGVNVVNAGAEAGIDLAGKVGDKAASGIVVGSTIANDGLTTLGNGMIVAGTGVNVVSSGLASLLDAIGMRLSLGIGKTEQIIAGLLDTGVLKLENGALSFSTSAQANAYNVLNSFLQILVNVQKLFENLRVNINTSGVANIPTDGTGSNKASGTVGGSTKGTANKSAVSGNGRTAKSFIDEPFSEVEEPIIEVEQPITEVEEHKSIELSES